MRKDAGVVERGGLENRCTLAGTQGSNPCLSANQTIKTAANQKFTAVFNFIHIQKSIQIVVGTSTHTRVVVSLKIKLAKVGAIGNHEESYTSIPVARPCFENWMYLRSTHLPKTALLGDVVMGMERTVVTE